MKRRFLITVFLVGCAHGAMGVAPVTEPVRDAFVQPSRPPVPLADGVVNAMLEPGDDTDEGGRFADTYLVHLDRDERIRVWVGSQMLDTMLRVRGPGGVDLDNDDFVPGSLDPLIEVAAPEQGDFLVQVTAFAPGQAGPYDVGLQRLDPAVGPTVQGETDQLLTITPGGAGPGIAAGASLWLDVRAGERLRIRVNSAEFDTTAAVFAPGGEVWINDDGGDAGPDGTERPLDSTLTLVATRAGLYHLLIAPYRGMGAGSFRVRVASRPPVVLAPGEAVPSVGFAGRRGEGRILGLFAGISDYADRSDLYACADDATLLARAFRERGLQSPEQQVVLADINANVAAFTAGLQQLASRSTPQDVVVIFFSGHGGTEPVAETDRADIDGTDETIVLYDNSLRDNEVVALIDQINADLIILALDSCHSGGFARDFLTRPGRIGLFSSDEDVLSDTAQPLLAGGYLSWTLRRAVLGEADFRPTDGVLFAGELTDFLHLGFVRHHEEINSEGGTAPMQWLVAQRGSITWNDTLWLYPRGPDGELLPVPDIALDSAPPSGGR
jgi:hypothetical protein